LVADLHRRLAITEVAELADLIPAGNRAPGLSAGELAAAQEAAGVLFPPDLCELLSSALPVGSQFPDWRTQPRESLEGFRELIVDGIHFDVLHNSYWRSSWGERPSAPAEVRDVVAAIVDDAPPLIPIYAHRGIPNEPLEHGNPVFSIMQTDIIVYGRDLADYLRHEFHRAERREPEAPPRTIRFWTSMLDDEDD
jgi:hypothetical protein